MPSLDATDLRNLRALVEQVVANFVTVGGLIPVSPVDANTLACVPLRDGSGTTPADLAGHYSPSLFNGPTWGSAEGGTVGFDASQRFAGGSYVVLNGSNQGLEIDTLLDTFTADGSVQLWFQPQANLASSAPIWSKVTKQGAAEVNYSELEVFVNGSGGLRARMYSNGTLVTQIDSRTATLNLAGRWHLLTLNWGTGGLEMLVDDQLEAADANTTSVPAANDTTGEGFFVGAYFDNNGSRFANVAAYGLRVMSRRITQAEHLANWHRRPVAPSATALTRLTRTSPYPLLTSNDNSTGETTIVYDGTQFVVHRNKGTSPHLNRDTSADFVTWTDHGNVLGQGTGGESSNVYQPSRYDEGGTTYFFYVRSSADDLQYATSTDGGATVTKQSGNPLTRAAVLAGSGVAVSGLDGTSVLKIGSTYYLWFEAKQTSDGIYRTGLATASAITGPYTVQAFPLSSLERYPGGTYGGPTVRQLASGALVMFYHASSGAGGSVPTSCYAAVSLDGRHWQQVRSPVLRPANTTTEGSQVANFTPVLALGRLYATYTTADNTQTVFTVAGVSAAVTSFAALLMETPAGPAQAGDAQALLSLGGDTPVALSTQINTSAAAPLFFGTAQAGAANTITLASGSGTPAPGTIIRLTGGTGAGQYGTVLSVSGNSSARVVTVSAGAGGGNWTVVPDGTTVYSIDAGPAVRQVTVS